MTVMGIIHILLYFVVVLALTKPLGAYMAAVFEGEGTLSKRVLRARRARDLPRLLRR